MSEISIYDVVPTPKLADKLIGTSVGGVIPDVTYNFTLEELLQLFIPNIPANTLQGVLDYGNTATQNINLTGTINTTNLNVLATANILDSNFSGKTRIMAGLYDRTNSIGTAGQVLRSTGTQVEWYTVPTVIPTLQQVLQSGNTSDVSIILTANITAVTATAANVISNTSLAVNGVLKDGTASAGGSNQILSSTGSGIQWVDMPVYNAVSPLLYDNPTKTFSIQVANSTQGGYLSNVDWINFDGKQDAISLTTTGTSGAATFVGNTLNIPVYTPDLSGYVPISRTLTINGVTYDLSANRSWTIEAGVAEVTATSPLFSSGGAYPDISISQSDSSTDGYLSSEDWLTFNSKQDALDGGTGLVKSTSGTITYITDNSANWNTAYNESIVSAAVTGTSTKLLTLNQQDGGTITASWSDADTGLTSVGLTMPSAFSVANSPLTSNGTIGVTGAGTTAQYIRGDGSLATFPSIISEAQNLVTEVYNSSGATLTKGTVVYINGGQGNLPTITKAIATGDPTSAQTYGVVRSDITNMNNGYVVVTGRLADLDTRDYTPGQQLYLSSTTAGAWTPTKQYAPAHLVYVAIVVRAHPTQGVVEVMIQNGYEMDELHNVAAQNPDNNDILQFKTSTNLWTKVAGTTTNIAEGTNLYYLDSRARAALSFTPGSGAYNSTTGVITIPTNTNQLTNGAAFITLGSLSALAPLSYNNTTGVFSISQAGASTDGYLSSTDWNTFNNKQPAGSYVPTSRLLSINGTQYDLSADRSWSVGTVTSVAALTLGTSGTDLSSTVATATTTPVITLNVPTSSAANRGALSAADWSTFNTKVGGVTASSPLASSGGQTPNITIQQASGSQNGYLSSTDWTTFNNKQAAGNYITSLTGEATASGPGAAAVTLNNASVTAKVLTGVNITGGTVLATDTMLTAFGKLQNQINGLIGSTIYQGVWNATTNNPTLASGVGTRGYYYIVNVAGNTNLNGITDWQIGDWAIFDGTAWQKVDNTESVTSVNGFTGAVSLTTDNIAEGTSNLYFLNSRARSALSFAAGSGAYNSTTGVITIPTNNTQITNGAGYITLSSLSAGAGISYNNTTGVITSTITQYTDALARAALSFTAGSGAYNSTTGVITIPTNTNQLTNGASFITLASLSAGTGISYNNTTGVITNTITQYTDALARAAISLTVSGSSGASTYNSTTGVLNVPTYTLSGLGGQPALSGTGFVKISGTTISYDNSTYLTTSSASSTYLPLAGGTLTGALYLQDSNNNGLINATSASGGRMYINAYLEHNLQIQGSTKFTIASTGAATFSSSVSTGSDLYVNGNSVIGNSNAGISNAGTTRLTLQNTSLTNSRGIGFYANDGTQNPRSWIKHITSSGSQYVEFSSDYSSGSSLSNWIFSGGNVGIGTTSPTGTLTIQKSTMPTGYTVQNSYLHIGGTNEILNGTALINFGYADGSTFTYAPAYFGFVETVFTGGEKGDLVFGTRDVTTNTQPSERMRITSGGNVGIGFIPTNAAYMLQVKQKAANSYGGIVNFAFNNDAYVGISHDDNVAYLSSSYQSTAGYKPLAFATSDAERMRVFVNGNIAIGTTTDAGYKLDVSGVGRFSRTGSGGDVLTVLGPNGYSNNIFLGVPGTTAEGLRLTYNSTDGSSEINNIYNAALYFKTNATTRLTIASTGAATFSSSVTATQGIFQSTSGNQLRVAYDSTYYWTLSRVAVDGRLAFVDSINGEKLTITTAGNVGIGTTAPSTLLEVYKSSASSVIRANYNGTTTFDLTASSSGNAFLSTSNNAMIFETNSTERMRITSGGNVLVGTTTATGSLNTEITINNSSAGNYAGIGFKTADTNRGYIGATSTSIEIGAIGFTSFYTNGSERMRITSGGGVNIGTTTGNTISKLNVQADATRFIAFEAIAAGGNKSIYIRPVDTGIHMISSNYISGSPYLPLALSARENNADLHLATSGNVLIGTTTDAGYKLYVNGTTQLRDNIQVNNGTAGTSPKIVFGTEDASLQGNKSIYLESYWMYAQVHYNEGLRIRAVNGVGGSQTIATFAGSAGTLVTLGSITAPSFFESSDATIKTLITDKYQAKGIESVVAKLYTKNGKEELGYYAQDVQGILPSAVSKGEDGLLSLSYREVHTAKIARLEKELEELKARLN